MKIEFWNYFFSALAGLCLFFLIYLPIEFLLTEHWYTVYKINPWLSTGVIFFFLLLSNLVNWQKLLKNQILRIFLFFLFVVAIVFYFVYNNLKIERQYLPKIYRAQPSWVIQGQLVEIQGVNFGPVWKRGKVIADGVELNIKDWNDNKIIAEAPVPGKFGHFKMVVKTYDGKISNSLPLEIRDPKELLQ